MQRNFELESKDNSHRKYNYEIDLVVREFFLKRIASDLNTNPFAKNLEIGSFDGSMSEIILKYLKQLDIVEPAKNSAEEVIKKFGDKVNVFIDTVENFSPKAKYDNIFLVHTLEHVDDPIKVLKRISEMLSNDGNLFIMVPNANALSRQIAVEMGVVEFNTAVTQGEREQGHLRTYTSETLTKDITDSGLSIKSSGGIFLKTLANFQLDKCIELSVISRNYLDACEKLSLIYPEFASSIYFVTSRE
jgi:2-polyprenyl-3-methyl-5-hydroxy-6-metoxy-1,4-benzoquinol methylase